MKKWNVKSIYIKWVILFTGLIITAQAITLFFVFHYIIPDIRYNLSERIYRKAVFIQDIHRQGFPVTDDMLTNTGDTDIVLYLFEMDTVPESIGSYNISFSMLRRAAQGEIVTYHTDGTYRLPFCLMALDNQIALLTPHFTNEITFFMEGLKRYILTSSITASTLIVFALIWLLRPIKRVTRATQEVAGGNFNITLETKSADEVGQLIRNFNRMTQALQKNEYLKKDFVSSVSHEFKTPITSIEGFARLLKNEAITRAQLTEYTDIIIREAARLSGLSSNLLQLSILDSGSFLPDKKVYLLDEQIREAVLLLENDWAAKQLTFEVNLEELQFFGNEALLLQVWINLLHNAVKFSPIGGIIYIDARREDNAVSVSITDQGQGVAPEHAEKIFDRFYKGDKSRTKEGSGLGLSIVKRILELSQGSIVVQKPAHRGACFVVTLPDTATRPL